MNLIYNTAIAAYSGAVRLAALSGGKAARMVEGHRQTLRRITDGLDGSRGYDLWVHVASLGEFEQARPLLERFLQAEPDARVLLSFFSPSGYTVRSNFHPRVTSVYLPMDTPGNARAFISAANPRMAVFVKYEFWGNYLNELHRRGVPTYLISAVFRPGQIFFRPWGGMFRRMLKCFTHLFVQDEASAELLRGIGIEDVTVAGDTRFDRVASVSSVIPSVPALDTLRSRAPFMLVAGSSWPKDEEVYFPWLEAHPEVCAIIAPHEFDKDRLDRMVERLGADKTVLLSACKDNNELPAQVRYVIVDCFGLLSKLYHYADAAYIGGGFGVGIHNINEAAAWAVPVIFGPNCSKFLEAKGLEQCGGGFRITGKADFDRVMNLLLTDKAARKDAAEAAGAFIARNIGATQTIINNIFSDSLKSKP